MQEKNNKHKNQNCIAFMIQNLKKVGNKSTSGKWYSKPFTCFIASAILMSAILMNFDFDRFTSDIKTVDSAHAV